MSTRSYYTRDLVDMVEEVVEDPKRATVNLNRRMFWINRGLELFSEATMRLKKTSTMPLVGYTYEYDMPADYISVQKVEARGSGTSEWVPVRPVDYRDFAEAADGYLSNTGTHPDYYAVEGRKLYFYPVVASTTSENVIRITYFHKHEEVRYTSAGTITISANGTTATGTGTAFTTLTAGDVVQVGTRTFTVVSVESATSMTITTNTGAAVAASAFHASTPIHREFHSWLEGPAAYACWWILRKDDNAKGGEQRGIYEAQVEKCRGAIRRTEPTQVRDTAGFLL